jgi:hypothetical protein
MMKSTSWLVFGMLVWSMACPVQAGEISNTSKLLCALSEIHECVAMTGCERVRPQEIGLYTSFISVDLQKREIRAKGTDDITIADKRFEAKDKFVLAGAEAKDWVDDRAVGYSLTISRATGDMVLTSGGDDVSFVVFGSCTVP